MPDVLYFFFFSLIHTLFEFLFMGQVASSSWCEVYTIRHNDKVVDGRLDILEVASYSKSLPKVVSRYPHGQGILAANLVG